MTPQFSNSTDEAKRLDHEVIRRYTDQPLQIPREVKQEIERRWKDDRIRLYALADLDAAKSRRHTWLALGDSHIAVAAEAVGPIAYATPSGTKPGAEGPEGISFGVTSLGVPFVIGKGRQRNSHFHADAFGRGAVGCAAPVRNAFEQSERVHTTVSDNWSSADGLQLRSFKRAELLELRESPGLACTKVSLVGKRGGPPLATLYYTHRQRRAVEAVRFLIDQQLAERRAELVADPDEVYARAVAQGIRDTQASAEESVAGRVARFAAAIAPYRWQVAFGL